MPKSVKVLHKNREFHKKEILLEFPELGKILKNFWRPLHPQGGRGQRIFVPKILEMSGNEFLILIVCSPREEMKKKINLQPTRGEGGCWPTPSNFWWKTFSFKELLYEKSKSRREKKITVKIAIHLHRCQLTAWMVINCSADACANSNLTFYESLD